MRWRGAARIEMFGRQVSLIPWRRVLTTLDMEVCCQLLVADDAPSQAADQAMARRMEAIGSGLPGPVVVASNDLGFGADVERLRGRGIAARQDFDLDPAGLLRLAVEVLADGAGRASAGGVGDLMARRFGLPVRGRLAALAVKAGLSMEKNDHGLWLLAATPLQPAEGDTTSTSL